MDNNYSGISINTLEEYVKYPMIYNAILREISKQAYNTNGMYARAIDVRVSLPVLSYILTPRKKSKSYKKRKERIRLILKLINHAKTTRDILRKLEVEGMYVGILRDTIASNKNINAGIDSIDQIEGLSLDDNFMIQPLDLDYCKIIGFQNNVPIACFNMQYFDQFRNGDIVNEIKNFPKSFLKAYNDYRKDSSKKWFILDYKNTIAITARSSLDEPYGRPYGLSSLVEMKVQSDYERSQYKLIAELASSIYYLILPPGEKMGTCALNSEQQREVIESFKNAVKVNTLGNQAKITTLSLPPNTQIGRFSKDSSLLKDTLSDEIIKKIGTNLGFASSALNAASEGNSSFAGLQTNIDIVSAQVFKLLEDISSEYTRVLNEYDSGENPANKIKPSNYIDIKYLPVSYINKNDFYDKMKDLFMSVGGSRIYMIAATGVDPYDYLSTCDEEVEDKMDDKYLPHITSYTASDSSDKANPDGNLGGRPQKKENDLSPNGKRTRDDGSNDRLKPSTK